MTPFMEIYIYEAPNFLDFLLGDNQVPCTGELLHECKDIVTTLSDNIARAQNQKK